MIPNFYMSVMQLVISRAKSQATIKRLGKKRKSKPMTTAQKISPVDVFKVVFEANAGGQPQGKRNIYELLLSKLSKNQLKELQRQISNLSRQYLPNSRESRAIRKAEEILEDAISHHLELSRQQEMRMVAELHKRLEELPIQKVEIRGKQAELFVLIENNWLQLEKFVRRYFAAEMSVCQLKVDKCEIIANYANQTPCDFIKHHIYTILSKRV